MKKLIKYIVLVTFLISMMPSKIFAKETEASPAQSSGQWNSTHQNSESTVEGLDRIGEAPAEKEAAEEESLLLIQPEAEIDADDILDTGEEKFRRERELPPAIQEIETTLPETSCAPFL
ncbi:MAG: hypothetical protein AAGU27_03890 [Dehalobacterium sp.]